MGHRNRSLRIDLSKTVQNLPSNYMRLLLCCTTVNISRKFCTIREIHVEKNSIRTIYTEERAETNYNPSPVINTDLHYFFHSYRIVLHRQGEWSSKRRHGHLRGRA